MPYDGSRFPHPPTLEEYMASGHVRVSCNAQRGFVDGFFEAQGREREAPVSVSHFAGVITGAGDLIATIPSYAADAFAGSAGLSVSPPPIPVPRFAVSLLWKVVQETRPEHVWLRGVPESCADVYRSEPPAGGGGGVR